MSGTIVETTKDALNEIVCCICDDIRTGNDNIIDKLQYDFDSNVTENLYDIALVTAAEMCNFKLVRWAISRGADVRKRIYVTDVGKYLKSPLYGCCSANTSRYSNLDKIAQLNCVDAIISAGADIDELHRGKRAAIHMACNFGNYFLVGLLIHRGANVNIIDSNGNTPLHYSAGNYDLMRLLISHGADSTIQNSSSQLPLDFCEPTEARYEKCVDLLNSIAPPQT